MTQELKNPTQQDGKRVFLFLQGHPSFFARNVANHLEDQGHTALRINFCLGDAILWWGRKSHNFRKPFSSWEQYLRGFIQTHGVTDIIYYADRKPYHQIAAKVAADLDIPTYAFEFGYLRPDWITLERGGMSAFSHFPTEPEKISAIANQADEPDFEPKYPYTKPREIFYEVTYNLLSYFLWFFYPFYKADRYYNPLVEYISGIPGLFLEKRRHIAARKLVTQLGRKRRSFFIFSLQLQSDYQLRSNAPFSHQKRAIEQVIRSFARTSDKSTDLILKAHPLDNGLERWGPFIKKISKQLGVSKRVHFIVGGNLTFMLKHAKGCVMINSTVGLHSVRSGCPVKVLGHAIFDIEGLTHQGSLDSFWTHPQLPNDAFVRDFVKAVAASIQVKGNFFTTKGNKAAVPAFANNLIERKVNGFDAFEEMPPRLTTLVANEPPLYAPKPITVEIDPVEPKEVSPDRLPVFVNPPAAKAT
ncbi:capsular polysaccharide export protein [Cohaesibacter marisflavi]|uniref:Capsular polysaccharide export protein n=1 Tax=Cohaesibacter marisflavi TaxID=655353 RepID=A0A1I5IST2_9HYPH|nr:capsular polysaccharide export protein [Cohaesibacter marisflavi]